MATALFSIPSNSNTVNINETIQFTNLSIDYASCIWEFGDGSTSNSINPVHEYLSDGVFNITLTVYDSIGAVAATTSQNITVTMVSGDDPVTTVQMPLNVFKRFDPSEVGVIHRALAGSNLTSNYPYSSSTDSNGDISTLNLTTTSTGDEILYSSTTTGHYLRATVVDDDTDRTLPDSGQSVDCAVFADDYMQDGIENDDTYTANTLRMFNCMDTSHNIYGTLISSSTVGVQGQIQRYGYWGSGQALSFLYPNWSGMSVAEKFNAGETSLTLPWVTDVGGNLSITADDTQDDTQIDAASGSRYRPLRLTRSSTMIGKVFYDEKRIMLDDPEYARIMCYNANRSKILPRHSLALHTLDQEYIGDPVVYYVTYWVHDNTDAVNIKPAPCAYTERIVDTRAASGLTVSIPARSYTGTNVDVIFATGTTSTDYPASGPYYVANVEASTDAITVDIDLTAATTGFTAGHYVPGGEIGSEWLGWGYLDYSLESDMYTMMAVCIGDQGEFNQTQNPTYIVGSTYVTEVGLYNENDDLIMIGKLDSPIEVDQTKYVTVKLELDL